MSKSHEFAWAAGFFDGEGWVKIQKRGGDKYLGYYLRIGINHVKKDPLVKIQSIFGGNLRFDENVVGNRKPRWVWILSTKTAANALKSMLPYMRNKNSVAELALEFQNTVGLVGQRVEVSTQLLRAAIAAEIKIINSRD